MWLFTSILLILSISVISSAYSRRLLGNYGTPTAMFGRPLKASSAIRLQTANVGNDVVCGLINIRFLILQYRTHSSNIVDESTTTIASTSVESEITPINGESKSEPIVEVYDSSNALCYYTLLHCDWV